MIRISNIKYPIELPEEDLPEHVIKKYGLKSIKSFRFQSVVRRSVCIIQISLMDAPISAGTARGKQQQAFSFDPLARVRKEFRGKPPQFL